MNNFSSLCDDFFVDLYINTELELPTQRDTVLAFFERIQKHYPAMGSFYRRDNGEFCLEEDNDSGKYRWVSLEHDRIGSGVSDPDDLSEAYDQDKLILELMPWMLSVNHLDIDSMDMTFAMDFECGGSHDEVIAEALFGSGPFGAMLDMPSVKPIAFSPAVVYSLTPDNHTQARISVESKTSICEPRKKDEIEEQAISLAFTIRRYPLPDKKFDALKSFEEQCRLIEELMAEKIVPNFVRPLTAVIAQKRIS
ncbi:MAG: hypothetical protein PHF37_10465 [Phycisphaerae bacterium]|nr:hypothetical protein [Phycisphaerae bacterium]